ncbi:MAG: patatin family protein [Eubacterium sp.]|nr:patatin family protein [Eubacterium sp.]
MESSSVSEKKERLGLVLEGGGMRGIYTSGVLDEFMERGVRVDGLVGVSAGILHGISYVSEQLGRNIRYFVKLRSNKRFMSLQSLIRTGNICETEFCYHEIPEVLAPFDNGTFVKNAKDLEVYSTATNLETGKAEYIRLLDVERQIDALRASASMPLVSEIVEYDGMKLLDGGTADSIPIDFMRGKGFQRNIVVLTQTEGYQKKPDRTLPFMKWKYADYPEYIKAAEERYRKYNATLERLAEYEKNGSVLILRPSRDLGVGRTEKKVENLKRLYKLGRFDARNKMEEILEYVKG